MKKVLLMATFAIASVAGFSQARFGAQIGANFASQKISGDLDIYSFTGTGSAKMAVIIGGFAQIPLSGSFNFRPELNYIQKHSKFDLIGTSCFTLNYLEIPLNFTYSLNAGSGNVFFGAGPSIGFGMSGKVKDIYPGVPETSTNIKFDGKTYVSLPDTDEDYHFKGLDFGLGFMGGYQLSNGLSFNLGYTIGLSNIDPNSGSSFKNNGFAIKVGYMFGGAAKK